MARPTVIAHRCGAGLWPENSLYAAHRLAAIDSVHGQVDGVEIDVHSSADDDVIVIHDATLERTTDGHGEVRALSTAALARTRLQRTDHETLSTLPGFLAAIDPAWTLSVELKTDRDKNAYPHLAERVAQAIADAGATDRAFVHAFHWPYLEQVRARLGPSVQLGANVNAQLLGALGGLQACVSVARGLGVQTLNVDHRLLDARGAAYVVDEGFSLALWTVNTVQDLSTWMVRDVASICTDFPARALAVREALP